MCLGLTINIDHSPEALYCRSHVSSVLCFSVACPAASCCSYACVLSLSGKTAGFRVHTHLKVGKEGRSHAYSRAGICSLFLRLARKRLSFDSHFLQCLRARFNRGETLHADRIEYKYLAAPLQPSLISTLQRLQPCLGGTCIKLSTLHIAQNLHPNLADMAMTQSSQEKTERHMAYMHIRVSHRNICIWHELRCLCMYVCVMTVHMYMYIHMYVYIYIYICVNMHIWVCTHVCVHVYRCLVYLQTTRPSQ